MNSTIKNTNPKDFVAGDKISTSVVPDTIIVALSMAFLEGMTKYGRYNYRVAGASATVYKDALDHHMLAWWNGEDIDEESGLPHLWKAAACIAILIDTTECNVMVDDRPPRAPIGKMMKDMMPIIKMIKEKHKDKKPYHYTISDFKE